MKSRRPFSVLVFAVVSAAFIVQGIDRFIERERFMAWGYMVLALGFVAVAQLFIVRSGRRGGTES